jgi:hypothetical protein
MVVPPGTTSRGLAGAAFTWAVAPEKVIADCPVHA